MVSLTSVEVISVGVLVIHEMKLSIPHKYYNFTAVKNKIRRQDLNHKNCAEPLHHADRMFHNI